MWQKPLYNILVSGRRLTVDVTLSAPHLTMPVPVLRDVVAEFRGRGYRRVLDFGAGNLRNSLPLLAEGFEVYAVEYQELFERSSIASGALQKMKKSARFRGVMTPNEFVKCDMEYDVVLLFSVVNVIPDPRHRSLVVKYCCERLRRGGLLVWIAPYFDSYVERLAGPIAYGDGFVFGLSRERQTFYTEVSGRDMDRAMSGRGLDLLRKLEGKNRCRLYAKSGDRTY